MVCGLSLGFDKHRLVVTAIRREGGIDLHHAEVCEDQVDIHDFDLHANRMQPTSVLYTRGTFKLPNHPLPPYPPALP